MRVDLSISIAVLAVSVTVYLVHRHNCKWDPTKGMDEYRKREVYNRLRKGNHKCR